MKTQKSSATKPVTGNGGEDDHPAPLWASSRALLAGHGEEFFSRWKKVARRVEEDEVHDLRVASRRLREGLTLFAPLLPGKKGDRLAKQVKKVTTLLGSLRNTDEAFLFFSGLTQEEASQYGPELEALLTGLRREREQAHLKLKKDLDSLDPEPLRSDFLAIWNRPLLFGNSEVDPFMEVAFFAGAAIMERSQALAELLPGALREDNSAGQHQLRIAVKKLRYRLEIIQPLLKSGYEQLHGALKQYQDLLGKLHDIDVFCEMVRERLEEGAGREALLKTMAKRRSRLYASFIAQLARFPIGSIGEKAREAL
jgi:CHAD domain-containing protein